MKAYIASTSDDLSEIRQKVLDALNGWGFEPINYEGNFYVEPNLNSHDVCLKNVEALDPARDCLIVIVDRIFGSLYNGTKFQRFKNYSKDDFSYGHISITWAEIALAYELGMIVIPFVYHESVVDHDEYRKTKGTGRDFQPKYLDQNRFANLKKFLDFITHQDKNNWREPYKDVNDLIEKLERKFFFSVINELILKRHAEKVLNNFKETPICRDNRPIEIFEKTEWFQSRRIREIGYSQEPIRQGDQPYRFQEKNLIDLLDDRSLTVLVANGGMGKTLASLYLLFETSRNLLYGDRKSEDTKGFTPIWLLLEPIEIPYDITVFSLIAEALMPDEVKERKERLVKILLQKGPKLLLILDALNEKGNYQKILIDAIIKFHHETIGKHKIIITYRKEQWLTGGAAGLPIRKFLSDEYHKVELLPLQVEQVQAYFNTVGMPELFNALGYIQKEMARIPLFMYFFQQLSSTEIRDFDSQAKLYEKILHKWVDAMIYAAQGYVRDIMPPKLIKELDDIEKINDLKAWIFFVLQELAFDNLNKGPDDSFSRDTLRDFFSKKLYEKEGLHDKRILKIKWFFDLFDLWTLIKTVERTGLLVLNALPDDKFTLQFVHSSIQEFLAARKLKETCQQDSFKSSLAGSEWNGVMIMLSGLLVDSGNLVYSILSRNFEGGIINSLANNRRFARGNSKENREWLNSLSPSDALLATECAINSCAINDEYMDEILVQALLHVGITSHSGIKYHDYNYVEWTYQNVMPYLIKLAKFRGVEVFERILSDPRTYRMGNDLIWYKGAELVAAKVLEKIVDERIIQFFVKLAKGWYTPPTCEARKLAIVVLGWIKNKSVIDDIRSLIDDPEPEIRAAVIDAVGYIGGDNAEEILIKALNDQNENVRSMAYVGVGNIVSFKAVDYLIRFLANHKNESPRVIAHAIEALGKIGDERAAEILVEIALTNRGLYDGGPWETENVGYVYLDAGEALGKIKSKKAVDLLLRSLQDKDDDVRSNAARILGYLKSTETVRPLIAALNDHIPKVRWGAAVSLGEIGDNSPVEPLLKLLSKNVFEKEKDKYVRRVATLALGKIKDNRAINRLCELLKDPDLAERAAHSLGEIGDDSIVDQLIQALDYNEQIWDHPHSVHGAIITALGKIRSKKAVQPLLTFYMKNKSATVIESLGYIGDKAAMELIAEELSSDNIYIRNASISALKNFAPDKVYSIISKKVQAESKESKKSLYIIALSRM